MTDFVRDIVIITWVIVVPALILIVGLLIKNHDLRKMIADLERERFERRWGGLDKERGGLNDRRKTKKRT